MAATVAYNICYCSECESGSNVSDATEESNIDNLFQAIPVRSLEMMALDRSSNDTEYDAASSTKISKIRQKYNLEDKLTQQSDCVSSTTDIDQQLPNVSSTSLPLANLHINGTTDFNTKQQKRPSRKKIERKFSAFKSTSDDSDTMQEEAEFSSTTVQELDQAWDVYQDPLYATGSDAAEEERLDPSSLIGDWDGSMDEETTVVEPVLVKNEFDWSEESDTEDISKLIEDSKMQLNIILEVIKELECDYPSVSCSDYIESCATCRTNIGCLQNLLTALNTSMGEIRTDNEYVTSLSELLENWQRTLRQLDEIQRPTHQGQKSKVRKRLRKKMLRKFSCDSRKKSLDPERIESFAKGVLNGRSGSLPEIEFVSQLDKSEEKKSFDVAGEKMEGDTKLMSALFFGLMAAMLLLKIAYSCFSDVDLFSFDVTFFINYLRENPPA